MWPPINSKPLNPTPNLTVFLDSCLCSLFALYSLLVTDSSSELQPNCLGLRTDQSCQPLLSGGSGSYPNFLPSAAHWLRPYYNPDSVSHSEHKTVICWIITFPTKPVPGAMLPPGLRWRLSPLIWFGFRFGVSCQMLRLGGAYSHIHQTSAIPTSLGLLLFFLQISSWGSLLALLPRPIRLHTKSNTFQHSVASDFLKSSLDFNASQ